MEKSLKADVFLGKPFSISFSLENEPSFANVSSNSSSLKSPPWQKRQEWHEKIRKDKRAQTTEVNRDKQILQMQTILQHETKLQKNLKTAINNYKLGNKLPLITLINQTQLNIPEDKMSELLEFSKTLDSESEFMNFILGISKSKIFKNCFPKQMFQKVVRTLNRIVGQKSKSKQDQQMIEDIFLILSRCYSTVKQTKSDDTLFHKKQFQKIFDLISTNYFIPPTPSLLHLFYILRDSFTLSNQQVLNNLFVQFLSHSSPSDHQTRMLSILESFVLKKLYKGYLFISQVIASIIEFIMELDNYNLIKAKCYSILITLTRQASSQNTILQDIMATRFHLNCAHIMGDEDNRSEENCRIYTFLSNFCIVAHESDLKDIIKEREQFKLRSLQQQVTRSLKHYNENIIYSAMVIMKMALRYGKWNKEEMYFKDAMKNLEETAIIKTGRLADMAEDLLTECEREEKVWGSNVVIDR